MCGRLESAPGRSAASAAWALIEARKVSVGRIERHQLKHDAVRPAETVLGRILAAPARPIGCDHVIFFDELAGLAIDARDIDHPPTCDRLGESVAAEAREARDRD